MRLQEAAKEESARQLAVTIADRTLRTLLEAQVRDKRQARELTQQIEECSQSPQQQHTISGSSSPNLRRRKQLQKQLTAVDKHMRQESVRLAAATHALDEARDELELAQSRKLLLGEQGRVDGYEAHGLQMLACSPPLPPPPLSAPKEQRRHPQSLPAVAWLHPQETRLKS